MVDIATPTIEMVIFGMVYHWVCQIYGHESMKTWDFGFNQLSPTENMELPYSAWREANLFGQVGYPPSSNFEIRMIR